MTHQDGAPSVGLLVKDILQNTSFNYSGRGTIFTDPRLPFMFSFNINQVPSSDK